jgi:hypothetical protein
MAGSCIHGLHDKKREGDLIMVTFRSLQFLTFLSPPVPACYHQTGE